MPRLALILFVAPALLSCTSNAAIQNDTPATRPAIDPALMRQVDAAIDQAIEQKQMPGAVLLVGRGDRTLYLKAYGARALEPQRVEMTADTIFDMASCTKPIATATSIMILADRGKLKLSDPVAKYLPGFAANGKSNITIEQLMMHLSGLIPDNSMADYKEGPSIAMQKILALKPVKEPGKNFWYSDMNYIILGELVRAVDGRALDQFAKEEIFQPLGMKFTRYNPPDDLKGRCAPEEKRNGRWMIGEVHDPRAYALGGVAGHAGVFSMAEDTARFCRMILNLGQLDGKRILSESAVRMMIEPRQLPDGNGWRSVGFDMDTDFSSCRGTRMAPLASFGHTGFTGTMFWMDSSTNTYIVLLANRVHPNGRGNVGPVRRQVATLAAEAVLGPLPFRSGPSVREAIGREADALPAADSYSHVLCGIDVLKQDNFKLLDGRKIALVTNHTGRDRQGNRTVDLLLAAKNLKLVRLLSPEHGLFGLVDEAVKDTTDPKTGLKVYSLYGPTNRPTDEMLEGVDTIVYDIQDVGARFYTYSVTLGYCMEAAAKKKLKMVVLDRPNPITGLIVDGPLADKDALSFIAFGPLPVAHGMTFGELARLYNGEYKLNCDLTIVEMKNWRRSMWFDETGLLWTNPSPNMRNLTQAELYTGVCLLEATNVSVGRGTDQPFELFGAPWIDGKRLAGALNSERLPGLRFVPIEFTPTSSKFAKQLCQGVYIIVTDRQAVQPVRAGLAMAVNLKRLFGDKFEVDRVGHLLRNKVTLAALKATGDPAVLPMTWVAELEEFERVREKYLIYR